MANQTDLGGANKVFTGSVNNGNPNHYRNVKAYCKNSGNNCIVAGIIVATLGTVLVTALDWLVKPIERPRSIKLNRRR